MTVAVAGGGASARLVGTSPSGLLCSTLVSLASSYALSPMLEVSPLAPAATVAWNFSGTGEAADVARTGLEVAVWPCGSVGTLLSLAATLPLLESNETAAALANAAWVVGHGIFPPLEPYAPPPSSAALALESAIPAVAYLALSEWTFMASLEAFGTGRSGTSHSALAVRRGGELFVAESTFGWPGGDGVQVRRACVRARAFLLV